MIVSVVMRRTAKILAPVAILSVVGCSQQVDTTPAFPDIPNASTGGPASKKPQVNMDRVGSEQGKPNP